MDKVEADHYFLTWGSNDILLLCSDGLTDNTDVDKIKEMGCISPMHSINAFNIITYFTLMFLTSSKLITITIFKHCKEANIN